MLYKEKMFSSILTRIYPVLVCGIAMLFYCYSYFLRVIPSVMHNYLMQTFDLCAAQFGALGAIYYFSYTLMQLPAGILYDYSGPRFIQFIACLIAVIGVGIFMMAHHFFGILAGRFFIGLGTAFAYIGVLKLASVWFPPKHFAAIAGLTSAVGMSAAILSDLQLTIIIQRLGYFHALFYTFLIGIILSILIIAFIRNQPKASHTIEKTENINFCASIIILFKNPQTWIIGLVGCLAYIPASTYFDLWAIPYLTISFHLTSHEAAKIVSCGFMGWIISAPLVGILSDFIKNRRLPLLVSAILTSTLFCILLYSQSFTLMQLYFIFFMIGFSSGSHPLCFALGKEQNPQIISGTAVAAINTFIMISAVIFQPIIGRLIDLHVLHSHASSTIIHHTREDYTYALTVIPAALFCAIFLIFFIKETSQKNT